MKCSGDIVDSDSVGIDSRNSLVWCGDLREIGPPIELRWVLGIGVMESGWRITVVARGTVISNQEDDLGMVKLDEEWRLPYRQNLKTNIVQTLVSCDQEEDQYGVFWTQAGQNRHNFTFARKNFVQIFLS